MQKEWHSATKPLYKILADTGACYNQKLLTKDV
jgi:hypothetical protein